MLLKVNLKGNQTEIFAETISVTKEEFIAFLQVRKSAE